ncbi:polygalacturonase 1 beta-like protein 3 [Aristolochia californica]|uniref:polygalacturonase 1 beta-like protein 3 n=1 Tax=Aristolochia californica TaxID=171875 RepID=UPI0035E2C74D
MKHPLLLLLCFVCLCTVSFASEAVGTNPFTPKASLLRYWAQKIPNKLPKPAFLLSKLSPLPPEKSAILQAYVDQNALSDHLPSFCAWANLFCFPQSSPNLAKHDGDSDFVKYVDQNFTNYGTGRLGGTDSFKNYSDGENVVADSFKRYSRDSLGHKESFKNYGQDVNVLSNEFSSYSTKGLGGSGDFTSYGRNVNVPDLKFGSYDNNAAGQSRNFASYSDDTNAGDQSFRSYGKNGNSIDSSFTSYGNNSNVIGSTFTGYGESGNSANDTFTSYGFNGNVPENTFNVYGDGGNAAVESFKTYRDQANVGDNVFKSYAKNSNAAKTTFKNYGNSANPGSDTFKQYGKGATEQSIGFKAYSGENTTFKDYEKKNTVSFAVYKNEKSSLSKTGEGITTNKWVVEEGKFFRESNLKHGTVMKMPDIADKMPPRSFLPRSLAKKLPFSSAQMGVLLKDFNSNENSTLANIVGKTLRECEREPSLGETKRCVTSAEDMIDFAVQVLGNDVTVKSTESLGGSKGRVEIGRVVGINGGKVTKSVSCHQSLFPYLVYFCHSVPKVRVYEADIMDFETKQKINHGLAICHIDTSAWGQGHGAFMALGGGPGKIEVCHWIFQNDMTWVVVDR